MRILLYLSVVLLITHIPTPAFTQPGSLDNTFGTGGIVITSLGSFGDKSNSMAIQTDGKILYGGLTRSSFITSNFALVRCNNDGSLDSTFGIGGKVETNIENQSEGHSIALQTNGKILLGGYAQWFMNLVRYNSNGTLDTTFGNGGKVITDVGGYYSERCKSVAIQSDGKILLGGYGQHNANDLSHFILVRYNYNGTLDSTFGNGGIVIGGLGVGNSLIIQSDEKILIGGSSNSTFALMRYNTNGTLDSTFGTAGEVITPLGINSGGNSLGIQSDGKILLGGYVDLSFATLRYNIDGSLDNTFGTGGIVIGNAGKGNSLIIQSDGKILLGGSSNSNFALVRYSANGTLDSTFGLAGAAITTLGSYSEANSLGILSDGKIVMSGHSYNGSKLDMAVVKYNSDLVGISENGSKGVSSKMYPNPFNASVTVQFSKPVNNAELIIYNSYGQKVKQITNFSGQEIQLFRDNLVSGIYFLHLTDEFSIIAADKLVISDK